MMWTIPADFYWLSVGLAAVLGGCVGWAIGFVLAERAFTSRDFRNPSQDRNEK